MSEDEAFIREIVSKPGDDLPRLVYADWLDERNDPRGTYLRAEQFARNRAVTKGFTPGWYLPFSELADALDPVWVARVTRAPFGVCCETHRFTGSQLPVSRAAVDRVAAVYGVPFSPAYTAFLMNYNGGHPEPTVFHFQEGPTRQREIELTWFHDIRFPDGLPPSVTFETNATSTPQPLEFLAPRPAATPPVPERGLVPRLLDRLRGIPEREAQPAPPPPPIPVAVGNRVSVHMTADGGCSIVWLNSDETDFSGFGRASLGQLLASRGRTHP